jgi:hypothetical protein
MTELARFRACMEYAPADRRPFWDWGAWPETIERWKAEGYDPERNSPASIADRRLSFNHWFFPSRADRTRLAGEAAELARRARPAHRHLRPLGWVLRAAAQPGGRGVTADDAQGADGKPSLQKAPR